MRLPTFLALSRSARLPVTHSYILRRRMSVQAAVAKLSTPLKDLVLASVQEDPSATASSSGEKDKAEVQVWIEKVASGEVKAESIKDLDAQLTPRTYLVGNSFSAADAALYGALHPILSQQSAPAYYAHPAVLRYFDHIQSHPSIRASVETLAPAFSLVQFDLEGAPKLERKPDAPREKKKKAAAPDAPTDGTTKAQQAGSDQALKEATTSADTGAATVAPPAEGSKGSKPKKEKKGKEDSAAVEGSKKEKKGGAAAPAKAAEDAGEPVPSMIDLRVGHIVDVKKHPDADGLYVEQIDFGEEDGPRTVVSGLVNYIPIEQMRDKYLVGVCNLKPANMRGVKSFAMVLCATSKDGKEGGIELIQPPAESKPGDRVYFEGPNYESATPLSQLNPKKKIFETIQPGFITLDTKEAAWVDPSTKSVHKIRTAKGMCIAPTLVGASLS